MRSTCFKERSATIVTRRLRASWSRPSPSSRSKGEPRRQSSRACPSGHDCHAPPTRRSFSSSGRTGARTASPRARSSQNANRYRSRGLAIVAPTRRYGYVESGRPAPPDKELRHILQVRDEHYPFLRKAPVPVADANYKAFGVAAVPMHVLIDRHGIVRPTSRA